MKKILARLAQGDSDEGFTSYNNLGNHQGTHVTTVGRNFKLGSFTLIVESVIAEGGFGVVFRVVSQHGHTYALKRTCVNNSHDLAVCKREITIVSSLSHKNILRYVDSKITDIQPGIHEALLLTAYYPGSLSQLINERKQHQRFTEAEVLRIFSDICEAVCRLHHCKTPIIHRDLKIENILIDERNNFILCDFGSATSRVLHPGVHGISRCEEEISRYTTLAYRAPEMVSLSTSVPLGPQIDIWALGCILYCLCFFNLPFGDSILAIQSGNCSLPDNSPYSERLHKLIGYILCVDPFKRPDIYQVCALVFALVGRNNPAQNLSNLSVPLWKDLTVPPRESQLKSPVNLHGSEIKSENRPISSPTNARNKSCSPDDQKQSIHQSTDHHGITNTSVAPRERPRPNCPSSNHRMLVGNTTVNSIIKPPVLHSPSSNNNNNIINSNSVTTNFDDVPDSSMLTVSNQNVSLSFQDSFNQQPTNFWHKRCPSDTSSSSKLLSPTLRHVQSLASLSQVTKSFDSMANSYPPVEYITSVDNVISSSKQTEMSTLPLPNVIIDQSTKTTTDDGVQRLSSGNFEYFLPPLQTQQPQRLSLATTPLQNIHCNQIMTHSDKHIIKTSTIDNVEDDDILFGAAFDAIRGSGNNNNKDVTMEAIKFNQHYLK
ncbi:AP2-associated protein kinase 1 [Schistosoma japonicum]|nr:AP2-associated protein kinase 1 [Schistosoma japonicum]